jgi:hypothetical protein
MYARVWVCALVRAALLNQHATRTRHIVTFMAPRSPPHFSTLAHKRHDFRKKITENKSVFLFSHSKTNSTRYCRKSENVFM